MVDLKRTEESTIISIPLENISDVEVDVSAPCHLVLVNSDVSGIEVNGMDFIARDYYFEFSNEKIKINHKRKQRLQQEKVADIIIYSPSFKTITANSACHISGRDTVNIDKLTIVVNGRGIYTTSDLIFKGDHFRLNVYGGINKSRHIISGKLSSAYYFIEGVTDIEAKELTTKRTTVIHRSFGDCIVSDCDFLTVNIYSTGNVYYTGNPEINFSQNKNTMMNATGKLIKKTSE